MKSIIPRAVVLKHRNFRILRKNLRLILKLEYLKRLSEYTERTILLRPNAELLIEFMNNKETEMLNANKAYRLSTLNCSKSS